MGISMQENRPAVVAMAIESLGELGTLPETTTRIIEVVEDPKGTTDQLNEVMSHDPALAARVLKLINSAFYGLPGQVSDLRRAILLLGQTAIRDVAISTSLGHLFSVQPAPPGLFDARDLWKHSIAVALVAKKIARSLRTPAGENEMFLAGPIHDLGLIVERQTLPNELAEVCRRAGAGEGDFLDLDCQVKRIHEYKRQLLNILHVITLYNRLKNGQADPFVPRTVLLAGKAVPGCFLAKLIVHLVNCVGKVINSDPSMAGRLQVVFIENYGASLAERIIPAAELSQQISTAGMEASGTGNMKFALNGALTTGTLDRANVEIRQEVGEENIFIFGLTAEEVEARRVRGHNPAGYCHGNEELRNVLDQMRDNFFSRETPGLFQPIVNGLLQEGDSYLVLADYASSVRCQEEVSRTYRDQREWSRKSILNTANMGKFSSDHTIREYAEETWQIRPVPVTL